MDDVDKAAARSKSENICLAHFGRIHVALSPELSFDTFMRRHAFMVMLRKADAVNISGLDLFERWYAEFTKRIDARSYAFRPVLFVTEKRTIHRSVYGVLLLPTEAFGELRGLKQRRQLRLIKEVAAIEVRAFDRKT